MSNVNNRQRIDLQFTQTGHLPGMDTYTSALTATIDSLLAYSNEYRKSYVLDTDQSVLGIRVPGQTIGSINVTKELQIVDISIMKDSLYLFKKDPTSLVKTYVGQFIQK